MFDLQWKKKKCLSLYTVGREWMRRKGEYRGNPYEFVYFKTDKRLSKSSWLMRSICRVYRKTNKENFLCAPTHVLIKFKRTFLFVSLVARFHNFITLTESREFKILKWSQINKKVHSLKLICVVLKHLSMRVYNIIWYSVESVCKFTYLPNACVLKTFSVWSYGCTKVFVVNV